MQLNLSTQDCYETAYGGFINISNLDGKSTKQDKQEAEDFLLNCYKNVPGFREQAAIAYKDIMNVIKNSGNTKSMDDLKQFGIKLGLEQEQKSSTDATGNDKSSCCLLL